MKKHLLSSKSKTASALQFHILFFLLWGFLLRLMVALLLQKLHLLRDGVLRFGLFLDLGLLRREDFADPIKVQKLLSERHSTAKRATLRRLSNHFVAYRVKDGLFKGYLIMDSRWSFMERQEFMKIVDEAQNTMK